MGFTKELFGGLLGGQMMPAPSSSAGATPAAGDKTAMVDAEETARRKRAAALAAGSPGQMTPAGGATGTATLARKTLLGL
jgi:hypothetical protein